MLCYMLTVKDRRKVNTWLQMVIINDSDVKAKFLRV